MVELIINAGGDVNSITDDGNGLNSVDDLGIWIQENNRCYIATT